LKSESERSKIVIKNVQGSTKPQTKITKTETPDKAGMNIANLKRGSVKL